MNKLNKIILATLGGVNTVFSLVAPIFVMLLIIRVYPISQTNQLILTLVGILSSLYRGLSLWIE